jgi:hypothetical protein
MGAAGKTWSFNQSIIADERGSIFIRPSSGARRLHAPQQAFLMRVKLHLMTISGVALAEGTRPVCVWVRAKGTEGPSTNARTYEHAGFEDPCLVALFSIRPCKQI